MELYKKDTFLSVTISNDLSNNTLELIYKLLDIDIVDRYINIINENNTLGNNLRFNYRKILSTEEIKTKFKNFQDNLKYINENYDKQLPIVDSLEHLHSDQNLLNDLHEEFEIYGDRLAHLVKIEYFNDPLSFPEFYHPVWPGNKNENDKELHEAFLLLNEQIHNFEVIFRNWAHPKLSLCTCLFDFIPAGIHGDLKAEDYMLFTPEKEWGWAYLGYNTLGKHWSSTFHDNDIEVVKRHQVRPQQRFAAETYLNFSNNNSIHERVKFYKWWHDNDISEYVDPEMKLKDFAFGYIPIACLGAYSINKSDYIYADEIKDKKDWNENVWSKYNTIKLVEIKYK